MTTTPDVRAARRRRPPWRRGLEGALWLAGLVAVAWVGWGWLDARLYQQRQERLLEQALAQADGRIGSQDVAHGAGRAEGPQGIPGDELASGSADPLLEAMIRDGSPPATGREGSARSRAARSSTDGERAPGAVARLDALGRIVVPRLDMSVMVADGIDSRTLRRAAGHIPGTSRLGSGGNVGIAGHRDSFFRPLQEVRAGDEVVVTTPGAISRYRVEWAEVVPPEDTSSLRPTPYSALTLVTCYPFHYVGNAPDRFVVRARLIESRAATAADAALLGTGGGGR